jgi:hypothetical protein
MDGLAVGVMRHICPSLHVSSEVWGHPDLASLCFADYAVRFSVEEAWCMNVEENCVELALRVTIGIVVLANASLW